MPIYEYECNRCHHRFDVKQAFRDDPLRECPRCSGSVRRVLHPAGIVFKGSGFYVTDNRKMDSGPTELSSKSTADEGIKAKDEGGSGTKEPVTAPRSVSDAGGGSKAAEKVAG